MPRTRQLKHDFFLNEELAAHTPMSRLLFAGLWVLADREGRIEDRPAKIKAQLFPYEAVDIEALLLELAAAKFIRRYEARGVRVVLIPNFKKHQHIHPDEKASVLPALPEIPGDSRKSPEIMPYSSSPSPSSKTTAPSAVDLAREASKAMERKNLRVKLADARLPFPFGQPPDRFEKGFRLLDLPEPTVKSVLERVPRLGVELTSMLNEILAIKAEERKR